MKVQVLDLAGEATTYENVDRVSYVNHESYGPGDKIGLGREEDRKPGDRVLVLNVNGFAAALIEV